MCAVILNQYMHMMLQVMSYSVVLWCYSIGTLSAQSVWHAGVGHVRLYEV